MGTKNELVKNKAMRRFGDAEARFGSAVAPLWLSAVARFGAAVARFGDAVARFRKIPRASASFGVALASLG